MKEIFKKMRYRIACMIAPTDVTVIPNCDLQKKTLQNW